MDKDRIRHYRDKLNFETDSWDLRKLQQAGENVIIVDARSKQAYHAEHIPEAINLPHRQISPETTSQLDKNALLVSYCDGIGCNASTKAALKLSELGFQVKELIGGLDWWKRDGYTTDAEPGQAVEDGPCGCD